MILAWQDARRKAQETLDHYWDGTFPVRVSEKSKKMGVTPYRATLPMGVSGMIIKEQGQEARSYADANESEERRRFTLAHELGHYVERVTLAEDNDFAFKDKREPGQYNLHEFYADEFAGSLLMPEKPFMAMVNEGRSLIEIAARFGVSLAAARKRKERLTINPPEQVGDVD